MRLARFTMTASLAALLLVPAPAWACSRPAPESIAEILESGEQYGEEVVGFHEQRHIVRIPTVPLLVNERSASVVIRYWGPQPNLSVASHGDDGIFMLSTTSCGSPARRPGFTSAHANAADWLDRPRVTFGGVRLANSSGGGLSGPEVALLEAEYGPATHVSLGFDDYVMAYALVFWRALLVFGVLGIIGYRIGARARRVRRAADGPIVAAAALGVTAITLAIPSFGFVDWLGLMAALAGSIGMGWILRIPWTGFGIAYGIYFAIRTDPLFVEMDSGDRRMQAALGALIIGAGALAWARRHWTRWPASLVVLAGTFFFVIGAAELRGYREMTKALALASIVTGAAGLAVWWLVFKERTLSSGAPAEPPDETAEAALPQPSR